MDSDYAPCFRPIGGMTMLSLLEAYLKQARGTLHDVVKIIKEESKRPPQKEGKKASVFMRIFWRVIRIRDGRPNYILFTVG